jgi:hypothetical protein
LITAPGNYIRLNSAGETDLSRALEHCFFVSSQKQAAKQNGLAAVELPPISTKFRRTTFVSDIPTDPGHWINKSLSGYFGVRSVKLSSESQDYKEVKSGEFAQVLRSIFQQKYKD